MAPRAEVDHHHNDVCLWLIVTTAIICRPTMIFCKISTFESGAALASNVCLLHQKCVTKNVPYLAYI